MLSTMANICFVSNCTYAEPAKPLINIDNSTVIKSINTSPLGKSEKEEKLRAYHARLDLMNDMFLPDGEGNDWQVENIEKHLVKKKDDKVNIFFKVIWFGGNKQ